MNTKNLKPRERDVRYSGPLSAFIQRVPEHEQPWEIFRWYRHQMRSWALHWRSRASIAAAVGQPVEEIARDNISLAITYRKTSQTLLEAIQPRRAAA